MVYWSVNGELSLDMLGLEKGQVRLVPYAPEWKLYFEREKAALQEALGSRVLDIQHVGSTSIPGMIAKPIVDIAIAVVDFEEARECVPLVEELGYEYKGEFGIPRRHYFVKGDPRLFHLHMSEMIGLEWQNTLLFRDYLRHHPAVAEEYALLKQQLAEKYPQDREAYLNGKTDFIEHVLNQCRRK
ncbi:MAG TPA: GrpB family protein [Anaerolineales bacterium]|nr:GrpB family protein [Anaerolineales bacterium]